MSKSRVQMSLLIPIKRIYKLTVGVLSHWIRFVREQGGVSQSERSWWNTQCIYVYFNMFKVCINGAERFLKLKQKRRFILLCAILSRQSWLKTNKLIESSWWLWLSNALTSNTFATLDRRARIASIEIFNWFSMSFVYNFSSHSVQSQPPLAIWQQMEKFYKIEL